MRKFNVAVVGATGAVGEELLRVMDAYDFPINNIIPLASAKSAGSTVEYKNKEYTVLELTETAFEENDVEIAFLVQVEVSLQNLQNLQLKQVLLLLIIQVILEWSQIFH